MIQVNLNISHNSFVGRLPDTVKGLAEVDTVLDVRNTLLSCCGVLPVGVHSSSSSNKYAHSIWCQCQKGMKCSFSKGNPACAHLGKALA